MADLTHLSAAVARDSGNDSSGAAFDHWGGAAVPAYVREWHRAAAIGFLGHLEHGETAEAIAFLRQLRYSRADDIDPWRLIEAVAERALAERSEDVSEAPDEGAIPDEGAPGRQ